jgi:hypothetical protein
MNPNSHPHSLQYSLTFPVTGRRVCSEDPFVDEAMVDHQDRFNFVRVGSDLLGPFLAWLNTHFDGQPWCLADVLGLAWTPTGGWEITDREVAIIGAERQFAPIPGLLAP